MKDDDILISLYNRKVEKIQKNYVVKDTVLGCNIPINKQIMHMRNEELVEEDSLRLTPLGKEEVMKILEKKMKK